MNITVRCFSVLLGSVACDSSNTVPHEWSASGGSLAAGGEGGNGNAAGGQGGGGGSGSGNGGAGASEAPQCETKLIPDTPYDTGTTLYGEPPTTAWQLSFSVPASVIAPSIDQVTGISLGDNDTIWVAGAFSGEAQLASGTISSPNKYSGHISQISTDGTVMLSVLATSSGYAVVKRVLKTDSGVVGLILFQSDLTVGDKTISVTAGHSSTALVWLDELGQVIDLNAIDSDAESVALSELLYAPDGSLLVSGTSMFGQLSWGAESFTPIDSGTFAFVGAITADHQFSWIDVIRNKSARLGPMSKSGDGAVIAVAIDGLAQTWESTNDSTRSTVPQTGQAVWVMRVDPIGGEMASLVTVSGSTTLNVRSIITLPDSTVVLGGELAGTLYEGAKPVFCSSRFSTDPYAADRPSPILIYLSADGTVTNVQEFPNGSSVTLLDKLVVNPLGGFFVLGELNGPLNLLDLQLPPSGGNADGLSSLFVMQMNENRQPEWVTVATIGSAPGGADVAVDGTLVVGGVFLTSFFLEGGSMLYSAAGSDSVVFKLLP